MDDPNRLVGPIRRSDALAVGCLAAAGYLIGADQWPGIAGLALVGAIFSGLSPRFKGLFGLKWGELQIGGTFVAPKDAPRLRGSTRRLAPGEGQPPPPGSPGED
jgi:hypothetical protein